VHISPDKRNLLSEEQEDGMYGALWTLRDASGQIVWRGAARLLQGARIAALLDNPDWSDRNELTAHFACDGDLSDDNSLPNQKATLIRNGQHWEWRSDDPKACQVDP
jgi:hypothetical protein